MICELKVGRNVVVYFKILSHILHIRDVYINCHVINHTLSQPFTDSSAVCIHSFIDWMDVVPFGLGCFVTAYFRSADRSGTEVKDVYCIPPLEHWDTGF
jgi:hypothetical protein